MRLAWILISIGVHVVVLLGLYELKPAVSFMSPEPPKKEAALEIEVRERDQEGTRTNGRKRKLGGARIRLSDLQPRIGFGPSQSLVAEDLDGASSGWGHDDWGVGGGDFKKIEHYVFYRRVWDEADGLLFYPGVFVKHKISGTVNTRLVFTKEGECDWNSLRIESQQAYLRVYVLDLMYKLCKLNFKPHYTAKKSLALDMSFAFAIDQEPTGEAKIGQERIVGNVLTFFRHSQHSPLQWRVGPFTGIFPIPYVNFDFLWLKEKWDEIANGADPFKEYRGR